MICKFTVKNFLAFADEVELDFYANMNIKRFECNYVKRANKNILKTVGFYGPNNTGKTCILKALRILRILMLNEIPVTESFINAFANKGEITSFSVEYFINGNFYSYSLDYNSVTKRYEKEKLELKYSKDKSNVGEKIFERSGTKLTWIGINSKFTKGDVLNLFSPSFPFMLMLNDTDDEKMNKAKKDYIEFAQSLTLIKMDSPINIVKTINLLQTDDKAVKFIKEFVKNCDLHIEDFGFNNDVVSDANIDDKIRIALSNPTFSKESLKIYSKHNGYVVPSIFFDSVGTLKLIALSGYIYEALHFGKVLLIDEIDSSLHHILTKSIVAMFTNILNDKAQLLFSTQDALLLNLKELFRKDQIWLVDIYDKCSSKIYRMSDNFTSRSDNGIRGDENITDYYLKGQFGSIPTPNLFDSLAEAVEDD